MGVTVKMKIPNLCSDFCSAFNFLLKQIVESCAELNSLWGYANIFGFFEVLVLKKSFQTANFAKFKKKNWKIWEN